MSRAADELLRAGHEHTGRMLQQLFCVVMEFAQRQGLSSRESQAAFTRAKRQLKRAPYRLADAAQFDTFLQIGELLATWYSDPAYLNDSGEPDALPLAGPKSFTALARRYLPAYESEQVADMMVREKLMDRYDERVAPRRRAAIFAKPNPMTLDRIPVLVHGLMSTVAHNTTAASRAQGTRCEQSSTLAHLPVELVPAFHESVKQWAQVLLDKADAWGRHREISGNTCSTRRTARVGVEVFTYAETNAPTRRQPRRRPL